MSMEKSGNVAIFWDYENCPAPAQISGYAIANSISALARQFGSIKVFKAYLEISDQSRSMSRSELQSSGVSLVDCPHNGRKDVADKILLVDMLSYAIDNPAPCTIFLISGDRDFAYALSVLKNRHYRVVLVKRPETHVSLKFQACICFDWYNDVVNQADNPALQSEQRAQGLSVPQDHPITSESPRQDLEVSSSPKHRRRLSSTSRDSTSNPAIVQEKTQASSHDAPKDQSSQFEPSRMMLHGNRFPGPTKSTFIKEGSSVPLSLPTQVPRSADIAKQIPGSSLKLPLSGATKEEDLSPLSSPIIWPDPAPTTSLNSAAAQQIVHGGTKSLTGIRSPATPAISAEELAEQFLKKEVASPACRSNTNLPINPPSAATGIENSVPTNAKPANATSGNSLPKLSQTSLRPGESTDPLAIPIVPPHFVILVEALQWHRSRGVYVPLRSVIGERISKKGATYQRAGVTTFSQYCRLAEEAGIVDVGGTGGKEWIRLLPKWYGVGVVAPSS